MVKKLTKQYETPSEGWSQERIAEEDELMTTYGLKNKKEIYRAESILRSLRREAREIVSAEDEQERKEIIERANRLGLVRENAELDEILSLRTTDVLDRRLQTAVNRKGYADTAKEARQLVVHGHIYIDGQRVNVPGYLLTQEEEKKVEVELPEPSTEEEDEDSEESSDSPSSGQEEAEEETEQEEADETETEEEDDNE